MEAHEKMIEAVGLTKRFATVTAVDNLSFAVEAGEVFGLLGPNGAGKTTTIRMLSALVGPTAGEARVAGYQLGKEDNQIRRKIGILTEAPGLYDGLSAERNMAFYAEMYDVADVAAQVEKYLRMLGLWERRHELVSQFSKGMRQKLAIARALLHEPAVLFLDEPTSGLDPEMARLVRGFIDELRSEGRTIVLTTHNLDVADRLCDRVGVIRASLLTLDTPKALRQKLFGRSVVFHLAGESDRFVDEVKKLPYVQSAQGVDAKLVIQMDEPEEHNPEIIRLLVGAGADIQFVGELRRSLEDIYLQIMKASEQSNHE
jgi:ABC-2 type transport system ATP-binding protein